MILFSIAPADKKQEWGGLMIEVKFFTPITPRLDKQKVPPWKQVNVKSMSYNTSCYKPLYINENILYISYMFTKVYTRNLHYIFLYLLLDINEIWGWYDSVIITYCLREITSISTSRAGLAKGWDSLTRDTQSRIVTSHEGCQNCFENSWVANIGQF